MSAIERIKGYCCKVTPEQWKELVKVADEVGVMLWERSWWQDVKNLVMWHDGEHIIKDNICYLAEATLIPFDSFLAKLRGDVAEPWTPKAGEMVEVSGRGTEWNIREFIAYRGGKYVCWIGEGFDTMGWTYCRPARPRMTRAEAEKELNCIITD